MICSSRFRSITGNHVPGAPGSASAHFRMAGVRTPIRAGVRALAGSWLLFGVLVTALPQPASAQTLREALIGAYQSNGTYAAARARQSATREKLDQAFAQGLPNLSATLESGAEYKTFEPSQTNSPLAPRSFALSGSMPLFRGFRTVNAVREARALIQQGDEQLSQSEQSLFVDVADAYANVVRDRRVARLRERNLAFLSEELRSVQARQREGDLTRSDVAQAEARREKARADLTVANADVAASEAQFAAVVGQMPGRLSPPQVPRSLIPSTLADAHAIALSASPAVASARSGARAADYSSAIAAGALLPTVSVEARYDDTYGDSTSYDRMEETTVMAKVTVPLYEGGANWSRLREARANAIAQRYEAAQAQADVTAAVTALFRQNRAALSRAGAARAEVAAARLAVRGLKREAAVGQRSIIDVLDAQRDLVDAEVSEADADRDSVVTGFRLIAQLGRGSAEALDIAVHVPAGGNVDAAVRGNFLRSGVYE